MFGVAVRGDAHLIYAGQGQVDVALRGRRELNFGGVGDEGAGTTRVGNEGSPALTKGRSDRQLKQAMAKQRELRTRMGERGDQSRIRVALSRVGHERGLLLVGLFKLSKAVFFTAVGAGALDLMNKNISDVVMHVIDALKIDPERHFVGILMEHVGLIQPQTLRRAGILSFLYAAVCVVEGTGLILEKRWAEYFTTILTAMGLPWESYELVERYSPYKVGLLMINLAVLLYLVWILKKRRQDEGVGYGGEGQG